MEYKHLGRPCRNFCIFAALFVNDPLDSRLKLVMTSFVAYGTGTVIFVDVLTGEGESIELPGDEGAWALLDSGDGRLLIGTCGGFGYLHCLDLQSRKWSVPLRDEKETYIWNLAMGPDGMVYGGTYPGCRVLRYDPAAHTLVNLGCASDDGNNLYSRRVFAGIPGKILINCGYSRSHIAELDISSGTFRPVFEKGWQIEEITREYIRINTGKEFVYYDPLNYTELEKREFGNDTRNKPIKAKMLASAGEGSIAGVRGQEYFYSKSSQAEPVFKRIPTQPPATGILTLAMDSGGGLWGSSALGQTIFRYDVADGEYWNSTDVCDSGGEVYGICCIGDRIFMSAYCNGDHIVYAPSKRWDRAENRNPMVLESLAPNLVRPSAKSTVGPDGAFWTGWMAKYGTYGGGLSRVDADTLRLTSWYDPIPGQALGAIAADTHYVYFTTYGYANGLETKVEPFNLGIWEPGKGLVKKIEFPRGKVPRSLCISGRNLLVAGGSEARLFDRSTLEAVGSLQLSGDCAYAASVDEENVVLFLQKEAVLINSQNNAVKGTLDLPGRVNTAVSDGHGTLCFAAGSDLYALKL